MSFARATVSIATTRIGLELGSGWDPSQLASRYRRFLSDSAPDLSLRFLTARDRIEPPSGLDPLFSSGGLWRLYRDGDETLIALSSDAAGPEPYRAARLDRDLTSGVVLCGPRDKDGGPPRFRNDPLDFPLGEALTVLLLGRGRGWMAHACAVNDGGRGYLLAGRSGDGKTTAARQWRETARVLNDDRAIMTRDKGGFRLWGTPWHGDLAEVAPGPVRLAGVFFLGRGPEPSARRLSPPEVVSGLLERGFTPLWDPAGAAFTLELLSELAASVPCVEIRGPPDGSIVERVRSAAL